jgi:hypothetical protein
VLKKVETDQVTRSRLGGQALADVRALLWAIDCQTCGQPFPRWSTPALNVYADERIANASLHHRRCQAPGWRAWPEGDSGTGDLAHLAHLTWRAASFTMDMAAGMPEFRVPMFLVNPSLEETLLVNLPGLGWQTAPLLPFEQRGLTTEVEAIKKTAVDAEAVFDGDRVSVHIAGHGVRPALSWGPVPVGPTTRAIAEQWGSLWLGVCGLVDPHAVVTRNRMLVLLGNHKIALTTAAVRHADRRSNPSDGASAPRRTGPA